MQFVVTLDSANIVFIGHFNPFLISPEWLSIEGIWTPKEVQLVLGGLKEDSVRFQGDGVEWLLSYNRMMISSAITDCGLLATEILKRLPHTPVAATGTNFIFQDPDMSADHPIFSKARALFPEVCDSPALFKWSVVMHEDGARVEVTFISGEQGGSFSVNRHRKTESTESALEAVSRFAADREYASNLVQRFLVEAEQ